MLSTGLEAAADLLGGVAGCIGGGVAVIGFGVAVIGPSTITPAVRQLLDLATKPAETHDDRESPQQGPQLPAVPDTCPTSPC